MATQEIYIRNASETEARGPFSIQQVADLAEAGQVTQETLVYDAETEQWRTIADQAELLAQVFPEKKKHTLKKAEFKSLNKPQENAKEISVQDMLAAAEGRTADTKGKADPEIAMARAARIGMIGAIVTCAIAAVAEILPSADVLNGFTPGKLLDHPLLALGAIDVILAVFLALGMASFYPVVRFRAALGLGLLGFMFYAQGLSGALGAVVLGSTGLYICTVAVSILPAMLAAAAGVVGMGLLAWQLLGH
ncbi:DUF4339 domain-containing protein [Opitutus sp. ER46]|uniref:DUF4339 domain-containing protein n=1 Tax=Opitutus sp. ER46 TaxID=2161864 RepID=UPI000D3199C0|nr:DUF4339 domain-containing protein [Opitutus sp. ER46]PTY00316.1 DUF4339 domain-containing protein [Opitutus sp. ER46]